MYPIILITMNFENNKFKKIIGLIAFLVGISLIAFSTNIPLPNIIVNIIGALLVAYGVLNLIGIIPTINSDDEKIFIGLIASENKKINGIIAFLVGISLIAFSTMIPLPNIIVNIIGALLIAYGVLNLIFNQLNL